LLLPRLYVDSWDIVALNPEARVYQQVLDSLHVRARYRYYRQSKAFFAEAPTDYMPDDQLVTADPKMTRFETHLVGLQALVTLDALKGSPLDFVASGTLDVSFDHIWNTNRFGNGIIAQTGIRVPF
jgi:hypothetical protein